jgi:hypothetical protein
MNRHHMIIRRSRPRGANRHEHGSHEEPDEKAYSTHGAQLP